MAVVHRPYERPLTTESGESTSFDIRSRLDGRMPNVAALLEDAETDIVAFYGFPRRPLAQADSTNPLERFNKQIGLRTDIVGIFPDDQRLIRFARMLGIA